MRILQNIFPYYLTWKIDFWLKSLSEKTKFWNLGTLEGTLEVAQKISEQLSRHRLNENNL